MSTLLTRRHVISAAGQIWCRAALASALGIGVWRRASADIGSIGPLQPPDSNGIRLPQGFSSRYATELRGRAYSLGNMALLRRDSFRFRPRV
jgi:hypothetical protein